MASTAHVVLVDADPGDIGYARRRLEDLERRWSRFLDASEVSRLNGAPEALVVVSGDTLRLVTTMLEAWRVTGGRYDPMLLAEIDAAGYVTSVDGSGRRSAGVPGVSRRRSPADVRVHPSAPLVAVPAGAGLDPGGIGKGLAADLVVTELLERGAAGALVGIGGDLAAAGTPPAADGWYVAVEDPLDQRRTLATMTVSAGGVATPSTRTRTWPWHGETRHHVLDPATGECSATDLAAVTVVARAGWEAEAHATAALLAGSRGALDYLERNRLDGFVTSRDGVTTSSPALRGAGANEWSAA